MIAASEARELVVAATVYERVAAKLLEHIEKGIRDISAGGGYIFQFTFQAETPAMVRHVVLKTLHITGYEVLKSEQEQYTIDWTPEARRGE